MSSPTKGEFGYIQKGNRYHWKINDEIIIQEGFKSKKEADVWIQEKKFEWRSGYLVAFFDDSRSCSRWWTLVDKKGREVKT